MMLDNYAIASPEILLLGGSLFYTLWSTVVVSTVVLVCFVLCLAVYQWKFKRNKKYILAAFTIFTAAMALGLYLYGIGVKVQRQQWLNSIQIRLDAAVAVVKHFEKSTVVPGHSETFSEYTDPVLPEQVNTLTWNERAAISSGTAKKQPLKNYPMPQNFQAFISTRQIPPPAFIPMMVSARNEYAVAKLSNDTADYRNCEKQIVCTWDAVPETNITYRVQWRSVGTVEWTSVYSGAATQCLLNIPNGYCVELRIRCGDGTPEDDILFNAMLTALDVIARSDKNIGYAYVARQMYDPNYDDKFGRNTDFAYMLAPPNDGNHDGKISTKERPTAIGEFCPKENIFFEQVINNRQQLINLTPMTNEWGTWIVAQAPYIVDDKVAGVVVIDYHAERWNQSGRFIRQLYAAIFFSFELFIVISLFWYIEQKYKNSQTDDLIDAMQQTILSMQAAKDGFESLKNLKNIVFENLDNDLREQLAVLGNVIDTVAVQHSQWCLPEHIADAKYNIDLIKRCADNIAVILDDLRDNIAQEEEFEKIQSWNPVQTTELVNDLVALRKKRRQAKDVQLTVRSSDFVPNWILADEIRMKKILYYLSAEAMDKVQSGCIEIEYGANISSDILKLKSARLLGKKAASYDTINMIQSTPRQLLYFSIHTPAVPQADKEEQQPYTQDVFAALPGFVNRNRQQKDAGLQIARLLAKEVHGNIQVIHSIRGTSTYTFAIDVLTADLPELLDRRVNKMKSNIMEQSRSKIINKKTLDEKQSSNKDFLRDKQICVVGTNKTMRINIADKLARYGAVVILADLPKDLLPMLPQCGQYHFLFMDTSEPDALLIAGSIRETYKYLPLVAVMAEDLPEERARAAAAGFTAFLGMPVEPEALIRVIAH